MSDVNERIVAAYVEKVMGWFTILDIAYKAPGHSGKGMGPQDVDILAYDPNEHVFYDIEVKYRSAFAISSGNKADLEWVLKGFTNNQSYREKALREYIPKGKKIRKILVSTRVFIGKSEIRRRENEKIMHQIMKKKGHNKFQVWYMDDLVKELYDAIPVKGRISDDIAQIIRMMKDYGVDSAA